MVALNCLEYYPDIYARVPEGEDPNTGPTAVLNAQHKRLYLALRYVLRTDFSFDPDGSTTERPEDFPGGFGKRGKSDSAKTWPDLLQEEKVLFASVYGILLSRNIVDPSFGRQSLVLSGQVQTGQLTFNVTPGPDDVWVTGADDKVLLVARFFEAVTDAVKRYNSNKLLFQKVFEVLLREGAIFDNAGNPMTTTLETRQLADVSSRLIDAGVSANDPQIRRFVIDALSTVLGSSIDGNAADIDISLPDLDAGTAVDIVAANVRAAAALYFSAMLEEMKFYAVADKVAEHFMIGMLPVSRGPAGEKIFDWIKQAPNRFTEMERRATYGRVFGLAQGNATDVLPNREYSDLWLRFLSTDSMYIRERINNLIVGAVTVTDQQVFKAARDLTVNLSLHGYALAHFIGVETQALIKQVKDMLSQAELLMAYGVNDVWQLVDRVSGMYLGGAANGVRYRTMAQAGGAIILWLADHAPLLSGAAPTPGLFDDQTLTANIEAWLAVTGMADAAINKYTDPVDLAQQPSIPPFAPTNGAKAAMTGAGNVVRSALDRAGLGSALPAVPQI